MRPGDRLVLYTDGLVEEPSAAGEAFGDDRFRELLVRHAAARPAAAAEVVVAEVEAWSPAVRGAADDLTLLVVDVPAGSTGVR